MTAEIHKIRDFPTDPKLLFEMILANLPNIESVVVSVVYDGQQQTFYTQMKDSELTYHASMLYHDVIEQVRGTGEMT